MPKEPGASQIQGSQVDCTQLAFHPDRPSTMPEPISSPSPRLTCDLPGDEASPQEVATANALECRAPPPGTREPVVDEPGEGVVLLCRRAAQVPLGQTLGLEHWWLMTPKSEAGMGACGGGVPSADSDVPYFTDTCINDHSGEHSKAGALCAPLKDVDPECVDGELALGRPLGVWTLTNQCQTFVQDVLDACKPHLAPFDGAEGRSGQ